MEREQWWLEEEETMGQIGGLGADVTVPPPSRVAPAALVW